MRIDLYGGQQQEFLDKTNPPDWVERSLKLTQAEDTRYYTAEIVDVDTRRVFDETGMYYGYGDPVLGQEAPTWNFDTKVYQILLEGNRIAVSETATKESFSHMIQRTVWGQDSCYYVGADLIEHVRTSERRSGLFNREVSSVSEKVPKILMDFIIEIDYDFSSITEEKLRILDEGIFNIEEEFFPSPLVDFIMP